MEKRRAGRRGENERAFKMCTEGKEGRKDGSEEGREREREGQDKGKRTELGRNN